MLIRLRKQLKSRFRGELRVFVSDHYKLIYVRIPKSGNTSIRAAIGGGRDCRMSVPRISTLQDNWTAFSFVRNPWSRLVSTYIQKASDRATSKRIVNGVYQGFAEQGIPIHAGMSFEEFCEVVCDVPDKLTDKHLQSQAFTLIREGRPIVPHIGKVERMDHDWRQLMAGVGLEFQLPTLNRTQSDSQHYSSYYRDNKTLIYRVADRYADDIRHFNYDFEPR